ncbi:MAG: DUF72 domain-containing protein [Gaiellaceae bacterium]|jgi:uncharacterized protein YecE (DUF72 family)
MNPVRIGTCSFADKALVKNWYPRGLAPKERLRYYAEHFDTVEIDSTYYRLPSAGMSADWAERTPPGFLFHIKAFAMMTRHPLRIEQLPTDLRAAAEVDERGRVSHPPEELRAEIFHRFLSGIAPLADAGKLGGILFQLPPYVVFKDSAFDYLLWARERLKGFTLLVEFRHASWLEQENRAQTLDFLRRHGMALVIVDAPRLESRTVIPTVAELTGDVAYVRFHGRNAATWHHRGGSAADRFDYLYERVELAEWVEPLRDLAERAQQLFAVFNNNNSSAPAAAIGRPIAQAPANALMLRQLLLEAGVSASMGLASAALEESEQYRIEDIGSLEAD